MDLTGFFRQVPRAALGFSGGVDSSYLLYAARKAGVDIGAYYIKTAFQAAFEFEDAKRVGQELGSPLTIVTLDVMSVPDVIRNDADRCYYCKNLLFGALSDRAKADGYPVLLDGTNASDDITDRPGFRALQELSVRSPLRECGLTKSDIRLFSKAAGLFTWNKPAYACLATRIKDSPLTRSALQRAERAEGIVAALGFSNFRVRTKGDRALVQVVASQYLQALEKWDQIKDRLSPLFEDGVILAPETRKEEKYRYGYNGNSAISQSGNDDAAGGRG